MKHFLICNLIFICSCFEIWGQTMHGRLTYCALMLRTSDSTHIPFHYFIINDSLVYGGDFARTNNFECYGRLNDEQSKLYFEETANLNSYDILKNLSERTLVISLNSRDSIIDKLFRIGFFNIDVDYFLPPCRSEIPDPLANVLQKSEGFMVEKFYIETFSTDKQPEFFIKIIEANRKQILNLINDSSKMIYYGIK